MLGTSLYEKYQGDAGPSLTSQFYSSYSILQFHILFSLCVLHFHLQLLVVAGRNIKVSDRNIYLKKGFERT